MKGQPLAYNRDNQEDKEPLFDTLDTALACTGIYAALVPTIAVQRDNCRRAAELGFSTATDLADYLVRKGVAFRDAHEVVGKAVRTAAERNKDLAGLSLEALRGFSPLIEQDVFGVLAVEGSVAARAHPGGTAPAQVRAAAAEARKKL
jgi:argininosuccinate lyase